MQETIKEIIRTDDQSEHEQTRKRLWINVCIGVASAYNCSRADIATNWANTCLKEFDKQFPIKKDEARNAGNN